MASQGRVLPPRLAVPNLELDEKHPQPLTPPHWSAISSIPSSSSPAYHQSPISARVANSASAYSPSYSRYGPPSSSHFAYPTPSLHYEYVLPPRRVRLWTHLKPWLPLLAYLATSLGFLVAVGFWRSELFQGLDDLSNWLKEDTQFGYAVLFLLIFATTFPPLPLYSTLIVLSGYTFGALHGAVLSYFAALSGALVVFTLSRYVLRDTITRWMCSIKSIRRVVRAIEKRPKLLFLIRLAPYPYNVMNCLLAASPTLTLRTYTVCTALSLFKVYIHTYIGASIRSFASYHSHGSKNASSEEEDSSLGMYYSVGGIVLCVGIVIYLGVVARRAVDSELDGEDDYPTHTPEEVASFLLNVGEDEETGGNDAGVVSMSERAVTPVAADMHLV